jgi:hypothetical protein
MQRVTRTRLAGMTDRRAILAVLASALILAWVPSLARADGPATTTITGQAGGTTVPLGDGNFLIVGTYRDSQGVPGTYLGRYHEVTTGYNSCRSTGVGEIFCGSPGFPYRCNLIRGEITLRSVGRELNLIIGSAGFFPPAARLQSGICQEEANPAIHDTYLMLLNRVDNFPATDEEFSRGYGLLNEVDGSLIGTSNPVGRSPVYSDDLALQLRLFAP